MTGYLPLSFIEEKVLDLENALFFSTGDAVLKMPTCVVRVLRVDELGQIWFVVPKPSQFIHTFDRVFPVKLNFFRKGRDYYLKILGKAFIVNDPEDINDVDGLSEYIKQKARINELVILKVQISHADYTAKNPSKISGRLLLIRIKSLIRQWFVSRPESPEFFSSIPATHSVHAPAYSN
jgi:general stress protein 26